jgi:formylglycine-generating enzyme required for sulfatase activity
LGAGVKLRLARVPAGTGAFRKEKREVREFCIGVFEVIQAQWKAIMGGDKNPSKFKGDDIPVETVSFDDARLFIQQLNAKLKGSGFMFRLPTETEWVHACRGGPVPEEQRKFKYYLDKPSNDFGAGDANFDWRFPEGAGIKGESDWKTQKVGSYEPNRLGLYDMHGNVEEWVDYTDHGNTGAEVAGGGYTSRGYSCHVEAIGFYEPGNRSDGRGFRVAANRFK